MSVVPVTRLIPTQLQLRLSSAVTGTTHCPQDRAGLATLQLYIQCLQRAALLELLHAIARLPLQAHERLLLTDQSSQRLLP